MKVAKLKAERRSALGRNQLKKLRAEGWMPAVVYGDGQEPVSIQISEWELEQHLNAHHKVFKLDIAGTEVSSFLQDVAYRATCDHPVHADFVRIDLDKPIETSLELQLIGHPAGLSKGGVLIKDHLKIRISVLPTLLPGGCEVDISAMNPGDVVRAQDVKLPEGVTLAVDADLSICHLTVPSAKKDEDGEEGDS